MTALRWEEARECVLRNVREHAAPEREMVPLEHASGRVLAMDVFADRAYPPFPRAMRDGFAVRAEDLPGPLRVTGEIRAGEPAQHTLRTGECIEIMTGAPVPAGADAVLMVEHVERSHDSIRSERVLRSGENIAAAGCEACPGQRVLEAGVRLAYTHVAVLATVGLSQIAVYAKPTVSIISTGDELVEVSAHPKPYQIRNSNAVSLEAQVARAGGEVGFTTQAIDTEEALRASIDRALDSELVLFSGGVSAGKYDLVESVLAEYDAEFFFTRVLIQPGQPAVFGRAGTRFFFGLPGNPASTMVTFELFARLALEVLGGEAHPALRFTSATLSVPFRHKTGLTRFLPARLDPEGASVAPVSWQGSGDVFAVARANAFLVAESDRESWAAGDRIRVLPA